MVRVKVRASARARARARNMVRDDVPEWGNISDIKIGHDHMQEGRDNLLGKRAI